MGLARMAEISGIDTPDFPCPWCQGPHRAAGPWTCPHCDREVHVHENGVFFHHRTKRFGPVCWMSGHKPNDYQRVVEERRAKEGW